MRPPAVHFDRADNVKERRRFGEIHHSAACRADGRPEPLASAGHELKGVAGDAHTGVMDDRDDEPLDSPATWENVVVGEVKEVVGRIIGDDELAETGEEQVEVAHEVREKFDESRGS